MNSPESIAPRIEHTLLRAEATPNQIDRLCREAVECRFFGVCIHPTFVRRAMRNLETLGDARPRIVSVAGFPLGANRTDTKADEARRALDDGADEIDMVAAIGALAAGDRASARDDIAAVARVVHGFSRRKMLKVILETAALPDERIILGCRCCAEGEADFVKTSTGFHPAGGATVEHVRLLHRHASPMGVKASGGIRSAATALAMIDAGATRIGTSAGVTILNECRADRTSNH